jgi:hypothetical protein
MATGLGANRADTVSSRDLLEGASVKNGRITLPSGRSYAFLQLPNSTQMTPAVAQKLKSLVSAGALVAGPKPLSSPSLQNFPGADAEVAAIGREVWGDNAASENTFGKGRVFAKTEQALDACKLGPDFSCLPANYGPRYTHRRDGAADIYFVSNRSDSPMDFTGIFRVAGKIPELWDAERGRMRTAPSWRIKDGFTEVDLKLPANTSVFVVLQKPATQAASAPLPASAPAPAPLAVEGSWELSFARGQSLPCPALVSWTKSEQPAIKYFSGTATYRKTVMVPAAFLNSGRPVWLDLGVVKELARVKVNGTDCGVAWHAPFRLEVTPALKAGANTLEIEITNTWANRLIGDEFEAEDCHFTEAIKQSYFKDKSGKPQPVGRMLIEFPDWLLQGKPRPSNRQTFCVWNYFTKDSPLMESGLLGPVALTVE